MKKFLISFLTITLFFNLFLVHLSNATNNDVIENSQEDIEIPFNIITTDLKTNKTIIDAKAEARDILLDAQENADRI